MRNKIIIVSLLGLLLLSACAQPPNGGETTGPVDTVYPAPTQSTGGAYPPPTQSTGGAYPPPTQSTGGAYPPPTQSTSGTPDSSNLTPAESAAIQAASDKYGIPADQFTIVSTEAVTWTNGCLGVVIPGVMCTDALVDGYRIILEANGQQFEFHTNLDGTTVIDAAQLQATLGFVVYGADGNLQIVNPNIPLGPTFNPGFNGFLPAGGSIAGTGYVYDYKQFKGVAIDTDGTRELTFIQKPTYGLAIWRGGENTTPMLAWGTQLIDDAHPSTLQISASDGSKLETLLTLDAGATPAQALVAEFWSEDGQSLYFSKEPVGIGGYIPFPGGSNLFKIDIATKEVTELIPVSAASGPQTCLDALSPDFRYVADHCTPGLITIRDLESGGTVTLQPPSDVSGFGQVGSARFSPDGSKVVYALAKGDPDLEQGWVAVGDSSGGESKTILVGSSESSFYTVLGWLDDQTILIQSTSLACGPTCAGEIYTLGVDGSAPVKVADGGFLIIIDNH